MCVTTGTPERSVDRLASAAIVVPVGGRHQKRSSMRLYHGTNVAGLVEVLPTNRTGAKPLYGATNPSYAYATVSETAAHGWAARAAEKTGGRPVVYEVIPLGRLEYDDAWDDCGRKCANGFRVVCQLRPQPPA